MGAEKLNTPLIIQPMNLDELSENGYRVLGNQDRVSGHLAFAVWVKSVADWLKMEAPNSGLVSEWHLLSDSYPVLDNDFDDEEALGFLRNSVAKRLQWLADHSSRITQLHQAKDSTEVNENVGSTYVNSGRLEELRKIKDCNFDLIKLIRLCEELDKSWRSECLFASIILTRAIIDHVPPIFQCSKFSDVANQYHGSKSFKDQMLHLHISCRKIADQHLHCSIRNSETLPTTTQVNFSNDLDVLLAEIVRLLKH